MRKPLAFFSILLLYCDVIQMDKYRLPKTVIPYFYNITTDIYPDMYHFKGITEIRVDVVTETNNITLHSLDLKIRYVLILHGEEEIGIETQSFHKDSQFLIIKFRNKLKTGKYNLWFYYEGYLSKNLRGLYSTNYTAIDLFPRNIAVTYFEPMDARRAFPCFDEPAFKANFSISVISLPRYIALSNMPLQNTVKVRSLRVRNTFETSPKMSTYFVSFALCDYESISYARGQIYTRASYKDRAYFAASVLNIIVETTEDYLKEKLPVSKLDIITVRQMADIDGMENLGLILLLEEGGLYKEEIHTRQAKQDAFSLIIHETVHQWFGDLVTCDWWNDLWLNEGITTLLESRIAEEIIPHWRMREQAVFYWIRASVKVDYLVTARSISQKAEHPSQYLAYFDDITYKKAAAVLLTLENVVGEENFRVGLQIYLQKHKYSTATGKDLWDAFQKGIEQTNFTEIFPKDADLITVMQSWEKQAGIPVLNVTRTYSPSSIQFSQKRFLLKETKNYTTEWYIPINIATTSKPNFKHFTPIAWLKPKSSLVLHQFIKPEDWLIVNKQASFYYLVNYDEYNWKLIASALRSQNFGNIPPLTRAKLLYDAFVLAFAGQLKFSVALQLIKYIGMEKDYIVLRSFFYVFELFYIKFSGLNNFQYLQTFLSNALQPTLEHLDIEEKKDLDSDEQHIDTLNRIQVIKWACLLGNQFCREATARRLKRGVNTISVDLKEAVICGSLRGADTILWNAIFQMSMTDGDVYENRALGCSENKDSLNIYMERTLMYNISVFYRIYPQGKFGTNYALDYLVKQWRKLNESLSEKNIINVITGLAEYLTTREQLRKLKSIEANLTTPGIKNAFDRTISTVNGTVKWVNYHANDITQWIKEELEGVGGQGVSAVTKLSLYVTSIVVIISISLLF